MVPPQLTELVDEAPDGPDWLREINFDGYRMHARLDRPRSANEGMTGAKAILSGVSR